jgi:hypothetical protein
MSVSPYFKHVTAKNEQSLLNDLTRETIFQRGLDLYYIPRINSDDGFDYLFGEDPENKFDNAILMEFYCENVSTGFDGSAAIGRFALELGDIATFLVSVTRFNEEVTSKYPEIIRPKEGDLIVFKTDPSEPMDIFEITFTEKETPFYQIGKSNVFRMETERFNYSYETMETGVDELDDDEPIESENQYQDNEPIQIESDTFVNFDESDPFSDGDY